MVVAALRYALGRHTYVPGAVIDWISLHWDSLNTNTKTVIVHDVFEYLFQTFQTAKAVVDKPEHYPTNAKNLFDNYDLKEWEKFAIKTYWKLDYSDRKNVDQEMNNGKNCAIWFAEKLYGTQPI
jgi:hypothetical protein